MEWRVAAAVMFSVFPTDPPYAAYSLPHTTIYPKFFTFWTNILLLHIVDIAAVAVAVVPQRRAHWACGHSPTVSVFPFVEWFFVRECTKRSFTRTCSLQLLLYARNVEGEWVGVGGSVGKRKEMHKLLLTVGMATTGHIWLNFIFMWHQLHIPLYIHMSRKCEQCIPTARSQRTYSLTWWGQGFFFLRIVFISIIRGK